jgi:hypothetical protein
MPIKRWSCLLGTGIAFLVAGAIPAEEQVTTTSKPQLREDQILPFKISPATTRITEPLTPDGMVDYAAALNTRMSQGVTPENNAGVLLIQVIGADSVPEAQREAFFKTLGIPKPGKRLLLRHGDFVEKHLEPEQAKTEILIDREPYWDQQTQSMKRPWSRKEFPLLADWLDVNADTLKLTVEACKRPRLYFPIVFAEGESLLLGSLSLLTSDIRELARLLTSRSMLALDEGQLDEAIKYQLACHRLAVLVGQQSTVIDALVSNAITAMACEADVALVASMKPNAMQLQDYRRQIETMPSPPKVSEIYNFADRLIALDAVCHVAMNKLDPEDMGLRNEKLRDRLILATLDWDSILKRFNNEYDEIVAALSQPTHAMRKRAITGWGDRLEKEIRRKPGKLEELALVLKLIGGHPPREEITRRVGNVLLATMAPAIGQVSNAEFRARVRRDLTIMALALAEYQKEQGGYPETLDALSPKYLKTIPEDRFTEKPLKYQRQEAGFLLYSFGANGIDDNGQLDGDGADDIAIRVPIPPES